MEQPSLLFIVLAVPLLLLRQPQGAQGSHKKFAPKVIFGLPKPVPHHQIIIEHPPPRNMAEEDFPPPEEDVGRGDPVENRPHHIRFTCKSGGVEGAGAGITMYYDKNLVKCMRLHCMDGIHAGDGVGTTRLGCKHSSPTSTSSTSTCSKGFMVGVALGVDDNGHLTGANILCFESSHLITESREASANIYKLCPPASFVCGVELEESALGLTSLNPICCAIPPHFDPFDCALQKELVVYEGPPKDCFKCPLKASQQLLVRPSLTRTTSYGYHEGWNRWGVAKYYEKLESSPGPLPVLQGWAKVFENVFKEDSSHRGLRRIGLGEVEEVGVVENGTSRCPKTVAQLAITCGTGIIHMTEKVGLLPHPIN